MRGGVRPDPEVLENPQRRRFTADYKARILQAADACTEPGEIGALLRREGLYSSCLTSWRKQRKEGALTGLTPKRRGRKRQKDPLTEEIACLRRENLRLQEKLRQAEVIIEVQKKVSEILGVPLQTPENEGNN
jgi:transposase-like protein